MYLKHSVAIVVLSGGGKGRIHHDDVAGVDVDLQIEGNGEWAIGHGSGTVGFNSDEINGDGEIYFANQVSQEEECADGHADDHGSRKMDAKVGGDFGGELGDTAKNLVFAP